MPTPSLLIVPARFKSGKMYSQIPTSGAGDFTVTRATVATRVNASGLIESVASGIPRLDYFASGGTVGCPALLVEPAATNLALQSENFGTTWTNQNIIAFGSGSVLNSTGTLDPYGTNLADFIVANTSLNQHRFDQAITHASGSYTLSAFLKAGGYGFSRLRIGAVGAVIDLSNGAVTLAGAGIVASSQNYGNGWYRLIISKAAATANETVRISIEESVATGVGNLAFTGNGTSGIYVFGAQYETGSVATSYIPTTTTTVTRNADVISVSGAVSGSIGQTEGTIYMEVDLRNLAKETHIIRIDDNTSTNVIALRTLTTNVVRTTITAPTTSGTLNISSAAFTAGIIKIAFAYKSGEIALSVNGATALTASGTFTFGATLQRINLGNNDGASYFNDRIRAAALYTTRLTNTQLAALTTP